MDQSTEVLEPVVKKILGKAEAFLMDQGHEGFVTEEKPHANSLSVSDIPAFIGDLKNEGIIPDEHGYTYVQYTVDNNESTYEEMATRFIVFDDETVKGVIPFSDVIAKVDWNYKGLTEQGLRLLIQAMLK